MTASRKKVCPACDITFARRKAGCCPNPLCMAQVYYPSYGSKLYKAGEVLLQEEKDTSDRLIVELEELISERENIVFHFQGPEVSEQRGYIYQIILRARRFFKAQGDSLGLSAGQFVIKLFHKFMDINWWYEHINSFRQLLSKKSGLSDKAKELYVEIRTDRNAERSNMASFGAMMAMATGE